MCFILGTKLKSNQKVIGCCQDAAVTTAPVGMSGEDSHNCSSQGSQRDKTDDDFPCPVVCTAPSSTVKAKQ